MPTDQKNNDSDAVITPVLQAPSITPPPTTNQSYATNFDPMAEIDLSNIEIIDSSKGDTSLLDKAAYHKMYSFICRNCQNKYEGAVKYDRCPRCGSTDIDDSQ